LSRYLEQLVNSENNLMVFREDELIFSSSGRGIAPLIEAIDAIGREDLAGVISGGAKRLLSEHGVRYEFLEDTDVVKAKDGVVFCPFERLVWDVSDPEEAHALIRAKLAEL